MNHLLPFYQGIAPDAFGRYLDEIIAMDDVWLEHTHNYIQWLFPNEQASSVYLNAPLITEEIKQAFQDNVFLSAQLRKALERMLAFYGLKQIGDLITTTDNWNERKKKWFMRRNHNALRITRILKCMMTLNHKKEAIALYEALTNLANSELICSISNESLMHWGNAISNTK